MSPITLYETTVPVFIRALGILSSILKKGEAFANEKGVAHEKLLEARLVEDMAALPFQVQRASDAAKMAVVRIGGVESVAMEDKETTFAELHERIQKTIKFLHAVDPKCMDGKDDNEVILKLGGHERKFTAKSYVLQYALPNFFFHITTAYGLLRHMGVPVGKRDFLEE